MIYKVSQRDKDKIELLDYIAIEHGFEVNSKEDVVKILNFIIKDLNLRMTDLGKITGLPRENIHNWINGNCYPDPVKFKKFLDNYSREKERLNDNKSNCNK